MSDDTYEGWRNYETWCVHLWLTNDEGTYGLLCEWCDDAVANSTSRADAVYELATVLEQQVGDAMPLGDGPATLWSDLLLRAFGRVDWREIAGSLIEESDFAADDE